MSEKNIPIEEQGIYDARQLGVPKMLLLGLQHTFAMFGATVLVPIITGLSVSTTLLMAGLGTLLFHFLTKGKVPVFLGSSFAFLGGYAAVAPMLANGAPNTEMLPYACGGVFCAGLLYAVLSALFKGFGPKKVMRYFPPVVTGPIIICIGLNLSPVAVDMSSSNWLLAVVALVTVIVCNIWGKGMVKIVPIVLGIVISYAVGLATGAVDFSAVSSESRLIAVAPLSFMKFSASAIISIMPIAIATMMEHIGDVSAISATTGKNYIAEPGLHRTLLGDGLATSLSAALGGPANTTYGENTGVIALTRVYDPKVVRIAAGFAIFLSFFPGVAALINTIPTATIGGISFVLYGMISAVGVRNIVENRVDFSKSRNLIIAAVILVTSLGFASIGGITVGGITLTAQALGALLGILLNAVLPGNDYVFDAPSKPAEAVTFKV